MITIVFTCGFLLRENVLVRLVCLMVVFPIVNNTLA